MLHKVIRSARIQAASSRGSFLSFRRLSFAFILPSVLFGSSFYGLRWCEYALTFQPERYATTEKWTLPAGAEEVTFPNRDHQWLNGWFINSRIKNPSGTVVFFHGQGGNISNVGWIGESLASLGFNVLLFDYRGYGKSEGRIANERDLYTDADAAYDFVVDKLGTPAEQVVLYGHSLGTTAVADLASRRRCGAIILESGISSASDMASVRLPWLPHWMYGLAINRFESAKKLATVSCPVLVAHGEPDNVVPTEEGRRLFAAANEPKRLIILQGADHGVSAFGGASYFDELKKFIRESLARRSETT